MAIFLQLYKAPGTPTTGTAVPTSEVQRVDKYDSISEVEGRFSLVSLRACTAVQSPRPVSGTARVENRPQ